MWLETKYKNIANKIKLVSLPLLLHCKVDIERASRQPNLRDAKMM